MKKLLIVLAIGTFAACNSGSSTTSEDSTATVAPDSSVAAPDTSLTAAPDTTKVDSASVDTTKH
ncbi:hypothetical protein [Parafilimonas sp.]|uniref:hypothetical protein n=1 Tax=Parafilimonas sp. TaxID=1969739 RepID=UPI0039E38095